MAKNIFLLILSVWFFCQPEGMEPGEPNPEGQQYLDAKSYIFIEVRLQKPIVPKREKEELAEKVAEYIPPRPLYAKRIGGAKQVSWRKSSQNTSSRDPSMPRGLEEQNR